MTILSILFATSIIASIAVLSGLLLSWKPHITDRILPGLVGLAAGTMLGSSFLHILPEAFELLDAERALAISLASFTFFFLIEKIFHWHHCHEIDCADSQHHHSMGYINLIGDGFHNFLDGMIIAAAFMVDPWLGMTTSTVIVLHELPQELGDFGVLLSSGFSRKKAILSNTFIALTVVLGGLFAYFFRFQTETLTTYLLPIAAGNFIYLSASDLVPIMKDDTHRPRSLVVFSLYLVGIALILLSSHFGPHH